jgi:ketosteroid isomerase-like protein
MARAALLRRDSGSARFFREWSEPFTEWQIELEALHDGGDKVVSVCRQQGRSKTSGLLVDMNLAMVITVENGLQTRMQMYADPSEALKAAGLEE